MKDPRAARKLSIKTNEAHWKRPFPSLKKERKKEKYPISINNGLKYGNSEDFDSFI